MFYGQCNDCGERWELGTAPTCKCPDEALSKPDFWEGYVPEPTQPRAWFTADELNAWADKKLKENPQWAEQPAQQEPVAYMVKAHGMLQRLSHRADVADELACQYREDDPNAEVLSLYTSPPAQRTWVGLTDEERKLVRNSVGYNQFVTAGEYAEHVQKATEFKLLEKNNG